MNPGSPTLEASTLPSGYRGGGVAYFAYIVLNINLFSYSIVSTLKPFETTITDRHVIRSFGIDRIALTLGISVINESYTISRLEH